MNIDFYVERDGDVSARDTIAAQFQNYLEGLSNPKSHASLREFRGKFVDSLQAMAAFLGENRAGELLVKVAKATAERASGNPTPHVQQLGNVLPPANHSVHAALEELRKHPLDEESPAQATSLSTIRVASDDFVRARTLLESAQIQLR